MIIRRIPVRVKMSVGFEVVGDLIANYLPGSAFFGDKRRHYFGKSGLVILATDGRVIRIPKKRRGGGR